MKRCPSCQKTFPDDAPDFCPNDGMRLVKEESATFDPERTVMTSGGNIGAPIQSPAQPLIEQQQPFPASPPNALPPTPSSQGQQYERPSPPPWQPSEGNQFQQQAGWPPAPQQSATPAWGSPYQQQQSAVGPYGAPFTPSPFGRRRALAIASLVCGVDIATIMAITFFREPDFTRIVMLGLPILAIALALATLFLALKRPARFGGVELAIAGLALGVAGLVYVLMRGF